jgi:hypothetical protein
MLMLCFATALLSGIELKEQATGGSHLLNEKQKPLCPRRQTKTNYLSKECLPLN